MQAPLRRRKLKRKERTRSDLGFFFLYSLADFVVEFLTGFLELTHAATETAGEFRELLGAEEEQDGDKDKKPFLSAGQADCEDLCRVHLSGSLGGGSGVVKGKFRRIRMDRALRACPIVSFRVIAGRLRLQKPQRLSPRDAVRQFSRAMPVISTRPSLWANSRTGA